MIKNLIKDYIIWVNYNIFDLRWKSRNEIIVTGDDLCNIIIFTILVICFFWIIIPLYLFYKLYRFILIILLNWLNN